MKMKVQHIEINPKKVSGEPLYAGTRLPIRFVFDYLQHGQTVQEFCSDYGVEEEKVMGALRELVDLVEEAHYESAPG